MMVKQHFKIFVFLHDKLVSKCGSLLPSVSVKLS